MPGIVPLSQLVAAVGQSTFVQTILSILQQLNFPVTSWRSGDPSNTMVQSQATISASFSTQVATMAAGGFLDYAAAVTPDPSVTPGVAPGWLDVLASSVYNVQNSTGGPGRIAATFANGQQSFTNSSGSPSGPYAIGTFHLSQPNGSTYHNTQTLTIATGTNSYPFAADVAGAPSSAGPSVITGFVTPIPGITTTNPAAFVGVNAESNPNLVSRCRAKLGSLSPNGPKLAFDYVSRTIPLPAPLVALSSGLLTTPNNPVNRTKLITTIATGAITLYVASAAGPYVAPNNYTGSASLAITNVTNVASPVITVSAHGYNTGDQIFISGTGLAVIDGTTWTITRIDANNFSVPSGSPGATSTTGTAYRQSDLDLIDKTVQTYCIPNAIGPYQTLSAPQNMIRISATCTLKRGSVLTPGQVSAAGLTALVNYFANLPLGGDNKGGASFFFLEPMGVAITNTAPNDIINVTFAAPGVTADVPVVTPQDVPLLNPASAILSVYEL